MKFSYSHQFLVKSLFLIVELIIIIVLWIKDGGSASEFKFKDFQFEKSICDVVLGVILKNSLLVILTVLNQIACKRSETFYTENVRMGSINTTTDTGSSNHYEQTRIEASPSTKRAIKWITRIICSICFIYVIVKYCRIVYFIKNIIEFLKSITFYILLVEICFLNIQFLNPIFEFSLKTSFCCSNRNEFTLKNAIYSKSICLSLLGGGVILILENVSIIAQIHFLSKMIDSVPDTNLLRAIKNEQVWNNFIGWAGLSIVSELLNSLQTFIFTYTGQKLTAFLRKKAFQTLIHHDIQYFDINSGTLNSIITSNINAVQESLTETIPGIISSLVKLIGSFAFMFYANKISIAIALLTTVVIPTIVVITKLLTSKTSYYQMMFIETINSSSLISKETIDSIKTIRSFLAEKKMVEKFSDRIEESLKNAKIFTFWNSIFGLSTGVMQLIVTLFITLFCLSQVEEKIITARLFFAFLKYADVIYVAYGSLPEQISSFKRYMKSAKKIFEIINTKPNIEVKTNSSVSRFVFDGVVEFRNVDFAYPSKPDVKILENFSLNIERGKKYAFVGPSGKGKSSIFNLILRFYDPTSGDILINKDKTSLKTIDLNNYRSQVSLVEQKPSLFSGTILENITLGKTIESDIIDYACQISNSDEFIDGLDSKRDTLIGENSNSQTKSQKLSGGQEQRLAIARSLVAKPKLLLLDEATSALDGNNEKTIVENLNKLKINGTTICMIAHRLSSIVDSDCIFYIGEKGKVLEQGTHQQLYTANGLYRILYDNSQMSN